MTALAIETEFRAGIRDGMTEEEYHGDPVPGGSLSSTGARKLLPPSCPAKYRWDADHPVIKAEFDFGTAAHKYVLGAGPKIKHVDAKDWRTNAAKKEAEEARAAGHVPLLAADVAKVHAMAAAIRRHPVAGAVFDPDRGGHAEQSLFWEDGATGIWCRARLDWMPALGPRRLIVADYKTTTDASPPAIRKAVANYGYYQQAAWYIDGVRALGLDEDPAFLFVFQEKTAPYLITIAELDYQAIQVGRERNAQACEIWRDCTEAGVWPGYTDEIELISLPAWMRATEGDLS